MAAVKLLKPVGISLIAALTDYAAAAKVMGEHGSLTLAVNDYVKRAAQVEKYNPTSGVVEELLAIMEEELKIKPKCSRDAQTMRSHLRQFATATKIPIQEITLDTAVTWLQGSTATDRSFNNKRTSLVRLGSAYGMASHFEGYTAFRVFIFRTGVYSAAVSFPLLAISSIILDVVHRGSGKPFNR